MKLKISLRFVLMSTSIFCVVIASMATLTTSFSEKINAAMEARKLSQYLWRTKGDFNSACDLIKSELSKSEAMFVDNWRPTNAIVDETRVIAFRAESSSGKTYLVLDDYRIGSESTRVWKKNK